MWMDLICGYEIDMHAHIAYLIQTHWSVNPMYTSNKYITCIAKNLKNKNVYIISELYLSIFNFRIMDYFMMETKDVIITLM